jgi:hypothetical protein
VDVCAARGCDTQKGMFDPRRLIALTAKWNGSEVGRIRLDEKPVGWNESKQIIIRPFPEGHDPTEGDVPACVERQRGQWMRSGIAVQHSLHTEPACGADQGTGIVLGLSGVHNHGQIEFGGKLDLGEEG